jgi:hypothetical protein
MAPERSSSGYRYERSGYLIFFSQVIQNPGNENSYLILVLKILSEVSTSGEQVTIHNFGVSKIRKF